MLIYIRFILYIKGRYGLRQSEPIVSAARCEGIAPLLGSCFYRLTPDHIPKEGAGIFRLFHIRHICFYIAFPFS